MLQRNVCIPVRSGPREDVVERLARDDAARFVPMERLCNMLNRTAEKLESLTGDGSAEFFRKMGTSLRIMVEVFRERGLIE